MKPENAQKLIDQTRQLYNAVAEDFSRTRGRLWPALNLFKDYIKDNDKVLDIGCGNGRLNILLEKKFIDYLGIDYSEPLIEIARENFPYKNFQVGNLLDLKIRDNEYDVVFLIAVLHHIPSEELRTRAIEQIARVLKPGGYLLMTNWNLWQPRFWHYHIKYWQLRRQGKIDLDPGDILRGWGDTGNQRYVHAFTKKELDELAVKHNFRVIANKYVKYSGESTNFLKGQNVLSIWQK